MAKPFSFISASLLLFCLSFTFAQDQTEPGMVPDAPDVAGSGTGLAPEPDPEPGKDKNTDPDYAGETCFYCNESEQLVVDLNYLKQVTDLLKGINENSQHINEGSIESIQSMFAKINPELVNTMFKPATSRDVEDNVAGAIDTDRDRQTPTLQVPDWRLPDEQDGQVHQLQEDINMLRQELAIMKNGEPAPAMVEDPDSVEQENDRPDPVSTGIDGLVLKHVNRENPVTGARARVVVGSHRKTLDLSLDSAFTHNQDEYVVRAIEKHGDDSPERRHLVFIENTRTGEVHNIPW